MRFHAEVPSGFTRFFPLASCTHGITAVEITRGSFCTISNDLLNWFAIKRLNLARLHLHLASKPAFTWTAGV